jgi:hypothetical protein
MNRYNIDVVFDELQKRGQCRSRSDFSCDWLGGNESYFRSIQSKGLEPSVEAQLNLAAKLREVGMCFGTSQYPAVVEIGKTCLRFYGELLDALLTDARSNAAN